jgi:hypothetical protein
VGKARYFSQNANYFKADWRWTQSRQTGLRRRNSLLTGKRTGKIAFLGSFSEKWGQNGTQIQIVSAKFPKRINRELNRASRETSRREQGRRGRHTGPRDFAVSRGSWTLSTRRGPSPWRERRNGSISRGVFPARSACRARRRSFGCKAEPNSTIAAASRRATTSRPARSRPNAPYKRLGGIGASRMGSFGCSTSTSTRTNRACAMATARPIWPSSATSPSTSAKPPPSPPDRCAPSPDQEPIPAQKQPKAKPQIRRQTLRVAPHSLGDKITLTWIRCAA